MLPYYTLEEGSQTYRLDGVPEHTKRGEFFKARTTDVIGGKIVEEKKNFRTAGKAFFVGDGFAVFAKEVK